MGVGGLDAEFSAIFRRAFASRVFPPEFIEQLGAPFISSIVLLAKPGVSPRSLAVMRAGMKARARHPAVRAARHRQDADGASDRPDAERARAEDHQRAADSRQVRRRVGGEDSRAVRRRRGGVQAGRVPRGEGERAFSRSQSDRACISQVGANSGLHIIIFDEIDAICKARGSGVRSDDWC